MGNNYKKQGMIDRFLNIIEKAGNALPHPATLFAIFAFLVIIFSWVFYTMGITVVHPGTGEKIQAVNLMSTSGLHLILTKMVTNFTGFAPLGTVMVAMLGIGIAESSGFIGTSLKLLVLKAPDRWLTFVIVFTGILSNTASEVGYVLLVPLAAIIFLAAGRHPIAGLAAAFAGVSGGYSANLLLGTIDPLLSNLSQEAAQIIDTSYLINPTCNFYFMAGSTFFIAIAGTWVTEKIVVPRLGIYDGDQKPEEIKALSSLEKRGLKFATIALLALTVIVLWGLLPIDGFLRDASDPNILKSPFFKGIVAFIFISAAVGGIAYGFGAKSIKSDTDVMNGMGKSMETLGIYIVLVFFAAQFVAYFKWTNLGLIMAVNGANGLKAFIDLVGVESRMLQAILVMIPFIFVSAMINLVMGSASAKWAIMAPVFIPMFMLLGFSPEFTQVAYRIGDSVTNIISPMMSYFALIVAFIGKYDKKVGIGTVISIMIPYSFVFLVVWIVILIFWILLGIPIGPGVDLFL
jgi:aminobenzoyl-glutamate transport protein